MDRVNFTKGHGAGNDFVIVEDVDGALDLTPSQVVALCHRRFGIGADGVLRVVRTAKDPAGAELAGEAEWFMDYRNSDGSVAEMCGNGVRVFTRYLVSHGLATPSPTGIPVATRAGVMLAIVEGDRITVDMGSAEVFAETKVEVGDRSWPATRISMGNPHAVAFIDSLDDAGPLREEPGYDREVFPDGVNVEFVVRRGERHVAMRVHERGSGETRSCGTGACAAMVAASLADQAERGTPYTVDVPGGSLEVCWTADDRVLLTGPAVLVAEGITDL